jgi:anti-sigma B factor antagonist
MRPVATQPFRVIPQGAANDGLQILHIAGAITTASAAAFQEAVSAATAERLILELTEVSSIDSMAIGALVRVFVSCHKSGRKLALVGLSHRVRNVLQITGVEALFETYATVGDAQKALA